MQEGGDCKFEELEVWVMWYLSSLYILLLKLTGAFLVLNKYLLMSTHCIPMLKYHNLAGRGSELCNPGYMGLTDRRIMAPP
jgi:hypothetical protein